MTKEEYPITVVLFKWVDKPANGTLRERLYDLLRVDEGLRARFMKTVPLERAMWHRIFQMNSKRISSEYKAKRGQWESSYKVSFILPIGRLSQLDLGKLTNHDGCSVCGDAIKPLRRCTDCHTISYCSTGTSSFEYEFSLSRSLVFPECQRADWKEHKISCRTLKGGTWLTVPFQLLPLQVVYPGMTNLAFNRHDTTLDLKARNEAIIAGLKPSDTPPRNIHNEKAFLIKMQAQIFSNVDEGSPGSIFIYDRKRSFEVYLMYKDDPETYSIALHAIKTTGVHGQKMYRWAKRVGEFQLSVCFDKIPSTIPEW